MRHAIWKYDLTGLEVSLEMPAGAVVVFVGTQERAITIMEQPATKTQPCLWASVDPKAPLVKRRFVCYGTGEEIDAGLYCGTFIFPTSGLVFHVFEHTE